jgi:hypothetical protein
MRPYLRLFFRGLALGLGLGLCLGSLVALLHRTAGCHPSVWPYDLCVGGLFGLVAGWLFSLQTIVGQLLRDLLGLLSMAVPWAGRAAVPAWLAQLDHLFGDIAARSARPVMFILNRWVRTRLRSAAPFLDAVELEEARRRAGGGESDPRRSAFAALMVLMKPFQIAFWVAYGLLFISASLFWLLPVLLARASQ